jgi:hypothetical protein
VWSLLPNTAIITSRWLVHQHEIDKSLNQDLFPGRMEQGIPLSELSLDQIRERMRYFRAMAVTASTSDTRDSLDKLADRYAALALASEAAQRECGRDH